MDWVLVLRLAIGAGSSFLLGMIIVVNVTYYKYWRQNRHAGWKGLLPFHVFAVSLSYGLLLAYATIAVVQVTVRGTPIVWWRVGTLIPAILLGLVAMYIIFQLRREERLRTKNL